MHKITKIRQLNDKKELKKYTITCYKKQQKYIIFAKDLTEVRHWIINHLDLSNEYEIKEGDL